MSKTEIWKDIKGFEGRYQVSNLGRVRGLDRWSLGDKPQFIKGKILKDSLNTYRGYYRVSLSDGHRRYTHYEVHRLVALHFVKGYKPGLVVNHKNEIKTDNRAENLEWCTQGYNLAYSDVVGYKRRTVYKYDLDGNFIAKYKCLADAEKEMGLSLGRLVHALYESKIGYSHGFRWSFHFTPKGKWAKLANKYKSTYRRIGQYDLNGNFIAKYESIKDASEKYGVSQTAICNCCHNKSKTSAGYIWKYMPF